MTILEAMREALYMSRVIKEKFLPKIGDAYNESLDDEKLRRWGVEKPDMIRNFGLLALVFMLLLIGILIYWLLSFLVITSEIIMKFKEQLRKKLFYSVWIRYMI